MPNLPIVAQPHPLSRKRPIKLNELIAGDILMFRPSKQIWLSQEVIKMTQALVGAKHGHYDTTHTAICVGHDPQGGPIIAHVHEKHDTMGFIKEKLEELFGRDDGDRPFLAFRHKNPAVRRRIAETAGAERNHEHGFRWELKVGLKTLLGFNDINPADEIGLGMSLSASTVCSKFVIEVMKSAHDSHYDNIQHYPRIHRTSSPKALEAYLYNDPLYDEYCYLGDQAFLAITQCIENQIQRFRNRKDARSSLKYQMAKTQYELAIRVINQRNMNELEKCTYLTQMMLPIFAESTGLGFFETTSHKALIAIARKMGVFQRDIATFQLEVTEPLENPSRLKGWQAY